MKKTPAGFTLFEIMLVITMSVSITAIGMVSLSRLYKIFTLKSASDEIRSQLQYGRELAIAQKDKAAYSVSLSGGIMSLNKNQTEISRYLIPSGVSSSPTSFVWNFVSGIGSIESCASCSLTLTSVGMTEIITIQSNGIIN